MSTRPPRSRSARRTAPSTRRCIAADGLGRRSPPVLPGAAAGRRDVQPVLLLPRRPADVRRPLRLRLVGHRRATRRCCGSCCPRRARGADSIRRSTNGRRGGAAMVSVGRILRDYREAGAVNALIALWGFVDDAHVPDEGGHVGLVYRAARVGRRRPDARAAASRSSTSSRRRCACSMSAAASTSTSSSRQVGAVRRAAVPRAPSRTRPFARRADYLNARREQTVRDRPLPRAAATSADRFAQRPIARGACWRQPARSAPRLAVRPTRRCRAARGATSTAPIEHAAPEGRAPSRCSSPTCGLARLREGRGVPVLPTAGQLRPGTSRPPRRWRYDTHLDYFVADSAVECHRDHLMVGRHAVKVLSMKEPPAQTFAHMLGGPRCAARASSSPASSGSDCRATACGATSSRAGGTSSTSASRSSTTCRRRRGPRRCSWTTPPAPRSGSSATR